MGNIREILKTRWVDEAEQGVAELEEFSMELEDELLQMKQAQESMQIKRIGATVSAEQHPYFQHP